MGTRSYRIYCCLSLSLLGLIVFGNHLHNTFQFDSVAYIKNNLLLRNPEPVLTLNFWLANFFDRGLVSISMAFNAYFSGLRPFSYHAFNLAFHIFNSILVFYVIQNSLTHFKRQGQIKGNSRAISFFVAAIFLVHPIQTESVIYVISRSEILASTFYLLAFFLFQVCVDVKPRKKKLKRFLLSLTIIFLVVAGFSAKQTAATFPLIVFLYYIAVCPLDSAVIKFLYKRRWGLLSGATIFLCLLFYKLLSDETFLIGFSNPDEMVGRAKYMLSQPAVVVFYYLKKILLPTSLNIDPDIEVITHIFSMGFVSSIGCIFLIIYSFWVQRPWRFYLFFLAWFLIVLSPSSSIVTLHDLAAEHRVYLALPGVVLILVYLVFSLFKSQSLMRDMDKPVSGILVLCGIVLFLGVLSVERNKVWRTELSLWQDTYKKSPDKLRPLINLARAHSVQGNNKKAVRYYEESLLIGPGVFAPNYNLGELYLLEGRIEDAVTRFKSALQVNPGIPETYAKLGEIYLKQGKWKLADTYFKKCVEIDNRLPQVFKNLGVLHFYHLKNLRESLLYFSKSLALDPDQKEAEEMRKLLALYQGKS